MELGDVRTTASDEQLRSPAYFIDLYQTQDPGPVVDDSDTNLHSLTKRMEGNNFDLRGIGKLIELLY